MIMHGQVAWFGLPGGLITAMAALDIDSLHISRAVVAAHDVMLAGHYHQDYDKYDNHVGSCFTRDSNGKA